MSIGTFEDAQAGNNRRLIRKALASVIYVKPYEEGDTPITQIWTADGGLLIPDGYVNVGMLPKASAAKLDNDTSTNDVESSGYAEPTRRDITTDISSFTFTMQQTHKTALELFNSVDLSQVKADADGNIIVDKPSTPIARDWRAFVLWRDRDAAEAFYGLDWFPNCAVTNREGLEYGGENVIGRTVTMTGFQDPVVRTAHRQIYGGPGIEPTEMGFTSA